MNVSDAVKEIFSGPDRTNTLATSNKEGAVNVAVFGSPQLVDDSTMAMMLGDNRTWANLSENPSAAFCITKHGTQGMGMEGCRVYVKVRETADSGEEFDRVMGPIRERIGDGANMLKHLVVFDITEVRPILDFGQGI